MHHQLGLRYLGKTSREVIQQSLVLVSEILCIFFFHQFLHESTLPLTHCTVYPCKALKSEECFPVSQEESGSRWGLELLGKKKIF